MVIVGGIRTGIVTPTEARALGLGTVPGLETHIRAYRNGRDLTGTPRGVMVIDLFGLQADEVRQQFPAVYQWLLERVKPERDQNPRPKRRDFWWRFAEDQPRMRESIQGLPRYIVTGQVAKHRVFQWLDASILPDDKLIAVASADALAAQTADRIIVLHQGRIHSAGRPEDVVTPEMLAEVYGVAARVERCSRGRLMVLVDGERA